MRLTIHRLKQIPTLHQAYVDLILQGHPLPSQADFYLATFNDKAVALAWCKLYPQAAQQPAQQQLDFIAVRDITRRRGIGQELLRQIKLDAQAAGFQQIISNPAQAPISHQTSLSTFLTSQGFHQQAGMLSCKLG